MIKLLDEFNRKNLGPRIYFIILFIMLYILICITLIILHIELIPKNPNRHCYSVYIEHSPR